MALAGEKLGIDYEKSLVLAAQTALGSVRMLFENNLTPDELIKNVATKGGCTAVGVDYLTESNTKDLFFELIKRTAEKSKTLG